MALQSLVAPCPLVSGSSFNATLPIRRSRGCLTRLPARCLASTDAASPVSEPSALVPRRCTLKELTFSEDGRLITKSPPSPGNRSSELMELFLATVEASAQVKDLETLTGRLAMVAFFVAISLEYTTGSGIFSGLDSMGLAQTLAVGLFAAVGAGAFAVVLRGKKNVTDVLASSCQNVMDSTVDSLVDALFFEESKVLHISEKDTTA